MIPSRSADERAAPLSSGKASVPSWRLPLLLARLGWLAGACLAIGIFGAGLVPRTQAVVGATLTQRRPGQVLLSPWPGGAAIRAGILEGDTLVAIDGRPVLWRGEHPLAEVLTPGLSLAPITLAVRTGDGSVRRYAFDRYPIIVDLLVALSITVVACVIAWRRSTEWPALFTSLTLMVAFVGVGDSAIALYRSRPALQPVLDLWFAAALSCLCLCLYLFPDGQFVPRCARALAVLLVLWAAAGAVVPALLPWHMAGTTGLLLIVAPLATGLAAQVYRYWRYAGPVARQQTKWAVLGLPAGSVGMLTLIWHSAWPDPLAAADLSYDALAYSASRLCLVALPLTIGVAILRYRLWDIDLIVNRALVYGALTACVIGLYVGGVSYLGAAFRTGNNATISLAATAAIALLFQPLRARVQWAVDRLMFGERDNPLGLLARLDQRLALALPQEAVLPSIVETLAVALKLPYAAITLVPAGPAAPAGAAAGQPSQHEGRIAATYGTPTPTCVRLPLVYGAEAVGYLHLAPRPGEGRFSPADQRLLTGLAAHAGVVVHAARLTDDLRRARERLVTAREEERRRLRRDLHDGLGPQLASLTLMLTAARSYQGRDPATAQALLQTLGEQLQAAVADVRRLVYALRPPALDDLGLVGALADQAARFSQGGPQVRVEVAAYRICLEALTNVVRHAHAGTCLIRLRCDPDLLVEIVDDGAGIAPQPPAGVGLRSMRERAEEVGGSCTIGPAPQGGTRVAARLPRAEG